MGERFGVATLWSAFFGVEHRATKCNAAVGRWGKAELAKGRIPGIRYCGLEK